MRFERKNKTIKERLIVWWKDFLCRKKIHIWDYYDKDLFKDNWLFADKQLRQCQLCKEFQESYDGKHWEPILEEKVNFFRSCNDFKPRFFKKEYCRLWRKCAFSTSPLGCDGKYSSYYEDSSGFKKNVDVIAERAAEIKREEE